MLEVRLLGTFEIRYLGKPIFISSRIAQSIFAYLVLTAGSIHRREKLAGMFWPDVPEEKARAYLRHELWRLRKAISIHTKSKYLDSDDIGVFFNSALEYRLDVDILTVLNEAASISELKEALSLYHGELLPGFYEDWVTQEREHLQVIFERNAERLLELLEHEKRWNETLEWAERWIARGRPTETAYRFLMIAYKALGDYLKVTSTYERCTAALQEMGFEPTQHLRSLLSVRPTSLNIPIPVTSFIGRETELKEVTGLLSSSRLVTLTGSGGVGKTRLSIQVAAEVLHLFPDGVWFLDLAPLVDPTLVATMLAGLLRLQESRDKTFTDALQTFFQHRRSLIIFDNCEHLIESCAELVHLLLASCADLAILATSREALRVAGEISYRVPSLAVPDLESQQPLASPLDYESVRLFSERAAHVSSAFAMSSQNSYAIARICQRLDGIPLAIELAAARVNVLSVEQILMRLDDRFNLLTGGMRSALPRHQTLRALIEWSYDLLSKEEQMLMRRLTIFHGGWTLEAAERICSGDGLESEQVLDLLSQLVNKSLVLVETSVGGPRYQQLETIRQFADAKLRMTTDVEILPERHFEYFVWRSEEIEPHLYETEQSIWMDYLDSELDNIRRAIEWAISHKMVEEAARLLGALGWFWFIHCHYREAERWFKQIKDMQARMPIRVRAKLLKCAGWLYFALGDLALTISYHQQSLALSRQIDDQREVSIILQFLGAVEYARGNESKSRPLLEESLRVSRSIDNKIAMPRALMHLGYFLEQEGDFVSAWRNYEESLAISREVGEGHLTMVVLGTMGRVLLEHNEIQKARHFLGEGLQIAAQLRNKRTLAERFVQFAEVLNREERYTESARLQGFAETLFLDSDALTPDHHELIQKTAKLPRKSLGDDVYGKEFEIGKRLQLEEALAVAMGPR